MITMIMTMTIVTATAAMLLFTVLCSLRGKGANEGIEKKNKGRVGRVGRVLSDKHAIKYRFLFIFVRGGWGEGVCK